MLKKYLLRSWFLKGSLISLLFFSSLANSMTVETINMYGVDQLFLSGEIQTGDLEKIKSYIKAEGFPSSANINSPGGDVMESIRISEFLKESFITISPLGQCYSACFIIYSGGYKRFPSPFIGIHRPYFEREYFAGLNIKEAEAKYEEMIAYTKQHLKDMEVSTSLIEKMMSINSNDMEKLSYEYVEENVSMFRSSEIEWMISKCGALTSEESQDLDDGYAYRAIQKDPTLDFPINNIERAKLISDGYLEYLYNKRKDVSRCESKVIKEVRSAISL